MPLSFVFEKTRRPEKQVNIFCITHLFLYFQCCNDVINERFASELKYDVALRLASLHIQEHAFQNNLSKVTLKNVE